MPSPRNCISSVCTCISEHSNLVCRVGSHGDFLVGYTIKYFMGKQMIMALKENIYMVIDEELMNCFGPARSISGKFVGIAIKATPFELGSIGNSPSALSTNMMCKYKFIF